MSTEWTTLKVLDWTTGRFERAAIDTPRLEAQVLLAHALKCDRVALYMSFDKPLRPEELASYRALIERRLAGEPVAYLVGEQEFWSLSFTVDRAVLIPRRDTETLIEVVLDEIGERGRSLRVADIATGSGAIAITLASELANATIIATDISETAVAMARKNAKRNELADRVDVRCGDLLEPIAGEPPFDIIAANLPYVPSADIDGLSNEVKHEPRAALDGGPDGLDIVRRLIDAAPSALVPGGLLVLEHGFDQADAITQLFAASGAFEPAQTRKDLGGQPRITWARRSS